MAVYKRDLTFCAALYDEPVFGDGITPLSRYVRRWLLNDAEPTMTPDREGARSCGGEFDTGSEDARWNSELAISMDLYPDAGAYLLSYLMGGGLGYGVAAAVEPLYFVHTMKKIVPPDYQQDSLAICTVYEADTDGFNESRGGIVAEARIGGSVEGDRRCKFTGRIIFNGNRVAVPTLTVPVCVPDVPYRTGSATISFGPYGGAAYTGKKYRSFYYTANINPDDEPELTGLYANSREIGDREFGAEIEVVGEPNDDIDLAFLANTPMFMNTVITHSDTFSDMTLNMPKCYISNLERGYATRINKAIHRITLKGIRDTTSPTTDANSPWYATVTNTTATYRT